MDEHTSPDVAEQIEAVMEAYGCSYEEAARCVESDIAPSAWDPEPEPPPEVRARAQAIVYETRERVRMREGFYLDVLRDDGAEPESSVLETEADTEEEEGDKAPPDSGRLSEPVRQRRPGATPPRTVRPRLHQLVEGRVLYPEVEHHRPRTRAECGEERPCPYVSCEYHLYLDVAGRGDRIRLNFPDLEVQDMEETCVLDLAERGGEPGTGKGVGLTQRAVAACLNLSDDSVRRIEISALGKLRRSRDLAELRDEVGIGGERGPEAHGVRADVRADVELDADDEEGDA